jgi:hypothetical protein
MNANSSTPPTMTRLEAILRHLHEVRNPGSGEIEFVRVPPDDLWGLVKDDGLNFRIILAGRDGRAKRGDKDSIAGQVAAKFRAAFNSVWAKLPFGVRQKMLAYWDKPSTRCCHIYDLRAGYSVPLIEVSGLIAWDESKLSWTDRLFAKLTFPAEIVVDQPEHLAWAIACTLADVVREAKGEDSPLFDLLFRDPYEVWEKETYGRLEAEKGVDAADEAADKKIDELHMAYRRQADARVLEIVRRWGFTAPKDAIAEGA